MLITGATGLLGNAVLHRMIRHPIHTPHKYYLCVRNINTAQRKIQQHLIEPYNLTPKEQAKFWENVDLIQGDIQNANNWLSDTRLKDVRYILNLAANTSYVDAHVMRDNYVLSKDMLSMMLDKLPNLERMVHVSSCFLFDDRIGNCMINEDDPFRWDCSHRFDYTKSKLLLDKYLMGLNDSRVIIARPSIAVGDSVYGVGPSCIFTFYANMEIVFGGR